MSQIVKELVQDRFSRVDRNVRVNFAIKFFSLGCTVLTVVAFGERYTSGKEHVFSPLYRFAKHQRNAFFGVPNDQDGDGATAAGARPGGGVY